MVFIFTECSKVPPLLQRLFLHDVWKNVDDACKRFIELMGRKIYLYDVSIANSIQLSAFFRQIVVTSYR